MDGQLALPIDLPEPAPADSAALLSDELALVSALLNALPDAIALVDRDGRILVHNAAAALLLGVARGSDWNACALARDPRHPDGRPFALEELPTRRTLADGARRGEPMVLRHATTGADVAMLAGTVPLLADDGPVLAAVVAFRDLGDFAERDRARDAFLRTVSHEMQVPLTAVRGYVQHGLRLLHRGGDPETVARSLERADANITRLVTLLRDVLDTSRLELTHAVLERLELNAFVRAVHGRLTPELRRAVIVRADERLVVLADPRLLETVLTNLVDNARKYGPEGGAIEIALARERAQAVLRVRDEGPGVPLEERELVFAAFRRGPNAQGLDGSGLGLYLCRQIAERHGGTLRIEPDGAFALRLQLA